MDVYPAPDADESVDSVPLPPATLARLGLVLRTQAVLYVVAAVIGSISYLVRGPDTLHLGWYATGRTHPVTMLVVGFVAAGLLYWHSRRIPARPMGLHRLITITEWVLLLDGVLGMLFGIFNIWWIAGLLATFAALWFLRTDDVNRYLE